MKIKITTSTNLIDKEIRITMYPWDRHIFKYKGNGKVTHLSGLGDGIIGKISNPGDALDNLRNELIDDLFNAIGQFIYDHNGEIGKYIIAGTYNVHCMYDQVNDIVTRQDKPELSLSLVEYKDNNGEITKYIDMYEKNFKNIWR